MDLEKSILNTLSYHALFNFPLKELEIYEWLFKLKDNKQVKLKLKKSLRNLVKKNRVTKNGAYYYFTKGNYVSRDANEWLKKAKQSQAKIAKAKKMLTVFSFFPWVEMIAISGNVAMNNASKKDDIDLMIITKDKRLWLSRLFVVSFLKLFGLRPVLNQKPSILKDKLCVNLWLDKTSLSIRQKNAFTAHEILALKPILNKHKTYERFIGSNLWAFTYWPNVLVKPQEKLSQEIKVKSNFWDFLNKMAHKLQAFYMKPKLRDEKISLHFAFFHKLDRSKIIVSNFKKSSF